MGRIVAIGGGEIGRLGYPVETTKIDKEIISLTGKNKPKLLFIPTASLDSESYYDVVKKHFGNKLGCIIDVLYLLREKTNYEKIENKVLNSDIIYVGGGNTLRMMNVWRNEGLNRILTKAYNQNIVLSGLSAGAMCWFEYGNSDSRRFRNPDAGLIRVRGLNFVNALFCPHYNVEESRRSDLRKMMFRTSGVGIAVDNCCALEIVDDKYRVIKSNNNSNAYKVYYKNGKFYQEIIDPSKEFKPLKDLLNR